MLDAALDLFSKKGYGNVSMQEIAEKSEFAIGTLYKFFKNKEDLYRALVREQAEKFHDGIMEAIGASDDEVEKLRNFVKAKGEIFRDNAAMIRLYFSETQGARHNVMVGIRCSRCGRNMMNSCRPWPRSSRAGWTGGGSGGSPTRTIWPSPSKA